MSISRREPAQLGVGRKSEILSFAILGWTIATITGLICGDSLAGSAGRATFSAVGGLILAALTYAMFRQKGVSLLLMLIWFLLMPPRLRAAPREDIAYSIKSYACFLLLFCLFGLIRRLFWAESKS